LEREQAFTFDRQIFGVISRRISMLRVQGSFVVAIVVLSSFATARANSIHTSTFRFTTGAEPAFQYVSGDLPCDCTAEVSGRFDLTALSEKR
jgi:hypothetical protein